MKNDNTRRMKSSVVEISNVWEVYSFHVFLVKSEAVSVWSEMLLIVS